MSEETRRCPGCGAEAPRPEARFCELCGTALPAARPPEPPPDPFGDVGARFRTLAASPELPSLLHATPEVPELAGKTLPSLLLLVFLGVLALFASLLFLQLCPPLGFAPVGLLIVGLPVLGWRMIRTARAPIVAQPALVVELRARLQAGAEHSPANTRHFVTLQRDDGQRSEHESYSSALAGLEPGALGVAYLKGERLAAFTRLAL